MEVEINNKNCFNLWFNELGEINYSRLIDRKLYTYRGDSSQLGLIETLSSLSSMDDEHFKLVCKLKYSECQEEKQLQETSNEEDAYDLVFDSRTIDTCCGD